MYKDPLVEDVRKARRVIITRCSCDMDKLFLWLKQEEKKEKKQRVSKKS